jgi:hypothetical protein
MCKGQWKFTIKNTSKSLQGLRWAEAILIKKDKPELNRKEERIDLSSLLL